MNKKKGMLLPMIGILAGISLVCLFPPRKALNFLREVNKIYEVGSESWRRIEVYEDILYDLNVDFRHFYDREQDTINELRAVYYKEYKEELNIAIGKNSIGYYTKAHAEEEIKRLNNIYRSGKYKKFAKKEAVEKLDKLFEEYYAITKKGISYQDFKDKDYEINPFVAENGNELFNYYEILKKMRVQEIALESIAQLRIKMNAISRGEKVKNILARYMITQNHNKAKMMEDVISSTKTVFATDNWEAVSYIYDFYCYLKENEKEVSKKYRALLKEKLVKKMHNKLQKRDKEYYYLFGLIIEDEESFAKKIVHYQIKNNFENIYFVAGTINAYVNHLLNKGKANEAVALFKQYPEISTYSIKSNPKIQKYGLIREINSEYHAEFLLKYAQMRSYYELDDDSKGDMLKKIFDSMDYYYKKDKKWIEDNRVFESTHSSNLKVALKMYMESVDFNKKELLNIIDKYEYCFVYAVRAIGLKQGYKTHEDHARDQVDLHIAAYKHLRKTNTIVPKTLKSKTFKLLDHYTITNWYTDLKPRVNLLRSLYEK